MAAAAIGSLEDALRSALGTDVRLERADAIRDAAARADPEALVALMGDHADSVSRNAAMDALTRGGTRSLSALVRALQDPDAEVVMFAAGVLGKTRERAAIPHLIGLLTHLDVNVVQQAIESLAQLRSGAAVGALLATLGEDPWLRFAAIHALGEIGDERAVGPLSELLADEEVRDGVIEALGKIGSPAALEHLARALRESTDPHVFEACLRAVGDALDRPPNHELPSAGPAWAALRSEAAQELHARLVRVLTTEPGTTDDDPGRDPRRAAAALIRALRLRSLYSALVLAGRDGALREMLTFYAVSLGDEIVPALRLGLSVSNANVRRLACECLGALAVDGEDASIGARLGDDDPDVRVAALRALTRGSGERHAHRLVPLLRDPHEPVRRAALETLARLDPRGLTSLLLASRPQTEPHVTTTLEIMRANPHVDQRPFIETQLGHASAGVRGAAVLALAAQRDGGVPRLVALMRDGDPSVRRTALMAIAATRSTLARRILLQALEEDTAGQVDIIHALAALDDDAVVPALVRLLSAPAPSVRQASVAALGIFGSATALRHVAAAAADPDPAVRLEVARVLAKSDFPTALSVLERFCLDPSTPVADIARRRLSAA